MKKVFLLLLILIFSITGCNTVDKDIIRKEKMNDFVLGNEIKPGHLNVQDFKNINVIIPEEDQLNDQLLVVSITPFDDGYILCDYQNIYLLKENNLIKLKPPIDIGIWNPTGVFYSGETNSLFVANYNGHNVIEFGINLENNHLEKINEMTHTEMVSPENVVAGHDGKYIAVADYDGNRVFLFTSEGSLEWVQEVKQAHGIALDENYVYATSLTERKIIKMDINGKVVNETGKIGWNENEYLWPTAITASKDYLLITDAHSGKLTFLNKDLEYLGAMGGNGPGIDAFNFPYTSIFQDGNIIITDSFKSRVLEVGSSGKLIKQYNLSKLDLKIKNEPILGSKFLDPYTFNSNMFEVISPRFFNPFYDQEFQVVSGFNSIDILSSNGSLISQIEIDYPNSSSYTGDSFWYVTWVKEVIVNGNDYYVFGSPQHNTLIIYDISNNIFSIKNSKDNLFDLWVINNKALTGSENNFDMSSLINDQISLFEQFNKEIKSGISRIEAYRKVFFPAMKESEYKNWLHKIFTTPFGGKFISDINSGKDIKLASKEYFFNIKSERYKYLLETLLVKTFSDLTTDINDITSNAVVTFEKDPYPGYGIAASLDDDSNTYTGYKEGMNPGIFELEWENEVGITDILIEWLSEDDIGQDYKIVGVDNSGKEVILLNEKENKDIVEYVSFKNPKKVKKVRFEFYKGNGQNRLLMKDFKVYGSK
ncbi:MAG TPA: hypothetical protein GXX18_02685 [Bacillales bacterium]|nr:hypothetical protein [Bacillales bacterium]